MATVQRTHKRRHTDFEPAPRRRRKSHFVRNTFVLLVVLSMAAVYFAPRIF